MIWKDEKKEASVYMMTKMTTLKNPLMDMIRQS